MNNFRLIDSKLYLNYTVSLDEEVIIIVLFLEINDISPQK